MSSKDSSLRDATHERESLREIRLKNGGCSRGFEQSWAHACDVGAREERGEVAVVRSLDLSNELLGDIGPRWSCSARSTRLVGEP